MNFAEHLPMLPAHSRDGMALWINEGVLPGSFLTAVLENDLRAACERADHINRYRLFDYVSFLYSHAPTQCWGSPENLDSWAQQGGLKGIGD